MKANRIKRTALLLTAVLCAVNLAACGQDLPAATTTEQSATVATTASTSATATAAPPEETTTTSATTEYTLGYSISTSKTPRPDYEGHLIYYEDFNAYPDSTDTAEVLRAIGWSRLPKGSRGTYSETDAAFALRDGRLYWDNLDTEPVEGRGQDGYYRIDMLHDDYMQFAVFGKYTLQYDITYTDAKEPSRYAAVITEYSPDGRCYNSFHFRIGGYGNLQSHYYNMWKTYNTTGPEALNPASTANDGTDAAPLCKKLLGVDYNKEVKAFANIGVTIRAQWNPEMGHTVYMKTADMQDFIKVAEPSQNADGPMYLGWDGYTVCFKIGGACDGYIDNILLWTGHGEQPQGKDVTYYPGIGMYLE